MSTCSTPSHLEQDEKLLLLLVIRFLRYLFFIHNLFTDAVKTPGCCPRTSYTYLLHILKEVSVMKMITIQDHATSSSIASCRTGQFRYHRLLRYCGCHVAHVDQDLRSYALRLLFSLREKCFCQVFRYDCALSGSDATCPTRSPYRGACPFRCDLTSTYRIFRIDSYITLLDYETMSPAHRELASTSDKPLANLLFDYPSGDTILRSQDSYHLRVSKIYITNSSSILDELIQRSLDSANPDVSPPVVQLAEGGEILRCLLTFIFPVTPLLPSTPGEIMELLFIAKRYQMDSVLAYIRDKIAPNHLLPTSLESALRIYSLAQKYGLRPEALQTAQAIFLKQPMPVTVENLDKYLDIMPGASLYEYWKYHERVQANLASDLTEFRTSGAHGTLTDFLCTELSSSEIPSWLDQYIGSIEKDPNLFDLVKFNRVMARHIANRDKKVICECASIPSQTIREFWEALASVVDGSFENVSVVDVPSYLRY